MSDFTINSFKAKRGSSNLSEIERKLERTIRELESVKGNLGGSSLESVKEALQILIEKDRRHGIGVNSLRQSLDEIIRSYEETESRICGKAVSRTALDRLKEALQEKLDELKKHLTDLLGLLKGKDSGCCEYGGDPINFSTGNFVLEKEYLQLKGYFPISVRLTYNST